MADQAKNDENNIATTERTEYNEVWERPSEFLSVVWFDDAIQVEDYQDEMRYVEQ